MQNSDPKQSLPVPAMQMECWLIESASENEKPERDNKTAYDQLNDAEPEDVSHLEP